MVPSASFVKRLKEIHRGLDVVWSPTMEIFCVYFTNPDTKQTFKILEYMNEDGSFRPLDERLLGLLRSWDTRRSPLTAKQIAQKQYEEYYERKSKAERQRKAESKYKARFMKSLFKKLATQLYDRKQWVDEKQHESRNTKQLLTKLGAPPKYGAPVVINP